MWENSKKNQTKILVKKNDTLGCKKNFKKNKKKSIFFHKPLILVRARILVKKNDTLGYKKNKKFFFQKPWILVCAKILVKQNDTLDVIFFFKNPEFWSHRTKIPVKK